MVKRTCHLCGKYVDERQLRRTTPNSHHTVVLLSTLVLFNAIDLETAKRCYAACVRIRQRLCDQHYIEAAQFIASEMACLGINFTTYLDKPRGLVVSYANEKDIPLHVIDSIEGNAGRLGAESVVSARKVSEFLNYCMSRYRADKFRASISTEAQLEATVSAATAASTTESTADVGTAQNGYDDTKPDALLCGTSSSPEVIFVGPDRSSNNSFNSTSQGDQEEPDETDSALLDKEFIVKGSRLLTLFRFCPQCGAEISRKKRNVQLSQVGQTPVVHYTCNSCQCKKCWYGM